jgi:protein TonB
LIKSEVTNPERPQAPLPIPVKENPAKIAEARPVAPIETETPPSFHPGSHTEGGGSEAEMGNLLGGGNIGVVPGAGSAGGGGTSPSGLGRGFGAPGLPAQMAPIKTNRQAKPVQTVSASYPPMALRMGLESDVTLRIEVDATGQVINAEVIKSGGTGFDEEAVRAVKLSRFEPAHRDGQNVPAEFTYIYRFRLRR